MAIFVENESQLLQQLCLATGVASSSTSPMRRNLVFKCDRFGLFNVIMSIYVESIPHATEVASSAASVKHCVPISRGSCEMNQRYITIEKICTLMGIIDLEAGPRPVIQREF